MDNMKISAGTRIGSMFLDHILMTFIAMIFFIPDMVLKFSEPYSSDLTQNSLMPNLTMSIIGLFGLAIYFCKDCINGRSIAKRILGLQLVDNTNGKIASPFKCLVRNLFIIFWPLELIVSLFSPSRRLGDFVAGTKLVKYSSTDNEPKIDFKQVGMVVLPTYLLLVIVLLIIV